MTGSALDEILPGRFVLGLGTGLPLRLKQMGIPYEPDAAVEGVSTAIDQIRALWAGERLAVGDAGPAADPADVPADPPDPDRHRRVSQGVRRAGRPEGRRLPRPPGRVDPVAARHPRAAACVGRGRRSRPARRSRRAGYLLSLVDKTRREALNRAKREPFVIYMMSVLSDVSLRRAGFDGELRDRIAAAWRAEDYTTAGNLIPDELLDAFMLCGTREDVAAGAMAFHVETGLRSAAPPAGPPGGPPDRRAHRGGGDLRLDPRSGCGGRVGARRRVRGLGRHRRRHGGRGRA